MNGVIEIVRNPQPFEGQQKAITILDRNLLVSAGAGSGKTWVLTERYLEIVSKGFSPSQIVAITFTEKAAGEMKERIREAVRKMASLAGEPEIKQFWQEKEQELKYSIISTIHGFCSRLLRAHPIESGLDPEFKVMDGIESGILKRDVFQEVVEQFLEDQTEEALLLYEEFGQVNLIVEAALDLFERIHSLPLTYEELWEETEQQMVKQQQLFHQRLSDLDQWVERMKEEFTLIKSAAKKPPKYFAAFEDWVERYGVLYPRLKDSGAICSEDLSSQIEDLTVNRWTKSGTDTFKEMTDTLREVVLPSVWECMMLPHYGPLLKSILKLSFHGGVRYQNAKSQRQSVDFSDLETMTARLLQAHASVCQKWQQRVRFLMVDEFQDTNSLQKSIVDCLTGQGTKMKVFVVGDGKQSIYRFRGADVQIFYQMEKEIIALGGEKVSLSKNFRTQAGIIGYINSLFSQLMRKDELDPPYYTVYEELDPHRKLAKNEPQVELICSSSEGGDETEEQHWVESEADVLARRLKQMVEQRESLVWRKNEFGEEAATPVQYGDICVLLAARSQMHLYEFAFQEYGIPYQVVGGRQFYNKQEVLDVINVLRVIYDHHDEPSLLGFLRSPFVQLSDTTLFWLTRKTSLLEGFYHLGEQPKQIEDKQWEKLLMARKWIIKWVQCSKWDPLASLIRQVLQDSGYHLILQGSPMGDQKLANVEKLIRLSGQLVEQKGYQLYDFIQFLKRMQEDSVQEEEAPLLEGRSNAVVLMSVHASKGLEFPVVCIPELRKDVLKKGGVMPSVMYQQGTGLALRLRGVEKGAPGNGLYESMAAEERDREVQEAKRLLYVALTRARDHLILLGSKSKGKNTWLQWIMEHLGVEDFGDIDKEVLYEQSEWKLRVILAEQVPSYPKLSEDMEENWQYWIKHFTILSDRDLGPVPFLDQANRWNSKLSTVLPTLSASALMEYGRCPKLFSLKYVEGLEGLEALRQSIHGEPKTNRKQLTSAEIGTVVHTLMETTSWETRLVPSWNDEVDPAVERLGFARENISEGNRETIRKFNQFYKSFVDTRTSGVFETEKQLLMLWGKYRMIGTLDLVQHHPDGSLSIYDFKTNHVSKSVDEVVKPYLLQGYLYVFLAEEVLGKHVSSMQFIFLDSGELFELNLAEKDRLIFQESFDELLENIQTSIKNHVFTSCGDPDCLCTWL